MNSGDFLKLNGELGVLIKEYNKGYLRSLEELGVSVPAFPTFTYWLLGTYLKSEVREFLSSNYKIKPKLRLLLIKSSPSGFKLVDRESEVSKLIDADVKTLTMTSDYRKYLDSLLKTIIMDISLEGTKAKLKVNSK